MDAIRVVVRCGLSIERCLSRDGREKCRNVKALVRIYTGSGGNRGARRKNIGEEFVIYAGYAGQPGGAVSGPTGSEALTPGSRPPACSPSPSQTPSFPRGGRAARDAPRPPHTI